MFKLAPLCLLTLLTLLSGVLSSCQTIPRTGATLILERRPGARVVVHQLDGERPPSGQREFRLEPGPHRLILGLEDRMAESIGGTLLGQTGSDLGRALDILTAPGRDRTIHFVAVAGGRYLALQDQGVPWVEDMRTGQRWPVPY